METQLNIPAGRLTTADRIAGQVGRQPSLYRRARPAEGFIQNLLFCCGVISIFTTIGIVLVLGNESLRFFSRVGWVAANNSSTEAVDASATTLHVATSGHQYRAGELIQIDDEAMLVTQVIEPGVLAVERGHLDTTSVAHAVQRPIYLGE